MSPPDRHFALVLSLLAPMSAQSQATANAPAAGYAIADQVIDEFRLDAHIPGIAYGIVEGGRWSMSEPSVSRTPSRGALSLPIRSFASRR